MLRTLSEENERRLNAGLEKVRELVEQGILDVCGPAPFLPGTPEKLAVLQLRQEKGLTLWHPCDLTGAEPRTQGKPGKPKGAAA